MVHWGEEGEIPEALRTVRCTPEGELAQYDIRSGSQRSKPLNQASLRVDTSYVQLIENMFFYKRARASCPEIDKKVVQPLL